MNVNTVQLIGFVGGAITTLGGVPQIIKMARTKRTQDLSWGMVMSWLIGLTLTTFYGVSMKQPPIYVNSSLSLIQTYVMVAYKLYNEKYLQSSVQAQNDHIAEKGETELLLRITNIDVK